MWTIQLLYGSSLFSSPIQIKTSPQFIRDVPPALPASLRFSFSADVGDLEAQSSRWSWTRAAALHIFEHRCTNIDIVAATSRPHRLSFHEHRIKSNGLGFAGQCSSKHVPNVPSASKERRYVDDEAIA